MKVTSKPLTETIRYFLMTLTVQHVSLIRVLLKQSPP